MLLETESTIDWITHYFWSELYRQFRMVMCDTDTVWLYKCNITPTFGLSDINLSD